MTSAVLNRAASLPDGDHYTRNLIGGRWQFPAAPYDFEIRNPGDSTITAVVPLSSRFDAGAAFEAASGALGGTWAEADARTELLRALLDRLDASQTELAQLQSTETGVSPEDSMNAVSATLAVARALLAGAVGAPAPRREVSGHILSWGLPFTEVVTSVFPAIARGGTVIVKPSLRGPLTPAAFAFMATEAGLPGGVVNIVQGTGVDIGADLITRRGLAALHVRAGERTIALAGRGQQRTGVALHVLRGGGNLMIVGPGSHADANAGALADAVVTGVRIHSSGGPFGLPLLAIHQDETERLLPAIIERLSRTVAAPLPSEPLRRRALGRVRSLIGAGADALLGGRDLPDDVAHRMGWRIPPTVLMLGTADSPAARAEQASVPLGPVLGVITWNRWEELGAACTAARSRDGIASICGAVTPAASLPHGLVIPDVPAVSLLDRATLPAAWLGGVR
jgi:acyl-CoA reductase-like NAD-dependent aldehyde dehydrogenase